MKKEFFSVALTFFLAAGTPILTMADDSGQSASESKAKIGDIIDKPNEVPGAEQVDDLITNNNLRALSGSLSRLSIASQFNYNGGTIEEPLAQDRPNISAASGNTTKADLDGAISAKYNIDGKNSVMAGIGMRWIAPMSTGSLNNYAGTTFDMMNPYVQYQYVYKWLGVQSVLQVQGMQWTQADYTALGYGQAISVDQENMYQVGKSRLSIGLSAAAQYNFFSKSTDSTGADLASSQSVYAFAFAPIIEYQLSSKVNLRTLVNLFTYEHYLSFPGTTDLVHDGIYQSIGVGVSITRDVFVYPNLQFLPGNIASNLTNVGVAATVNVF